MLDEFEAMTEETRDLKPNWVQQLQSFTQKEGDVHCLGYIINLAVQDALTQLKATPSELTESYRMEKNSAALPYSYSQDEIVSALSKLQRHIYIFRNRRQFESLLELQLKASAMKPKLLTLDMLI